jgi:hypothetical protein
MYVHLRFGSVCQTHEARNTPIVMETGSPTLNELALLLAGLEPECSSDPFRMIRTTGEWREHALELDRLFSNFATDYAGPFTEWTRTHLSASPMPSTVFYPFGGPDFMFAQLLHGEADSYLLGGLEPCDFPSELADPGYWTRGVEGLKTLADGLRHFLERSYFITSEMRQGFFPGWNGILAPLLVFLARTGHRVVSADAWALPCASGPGKRPEGPAVRIAAIRQNRLKQIFHLQQNLRDDHCVPGDPFFKFAGSFGPLCVLLKSASYLLHEPDFSHLRDFILQHGSCLVQDPSSIPYECLIRHEWSVKVHGRYQQAPKVFHQYEQPGLIEASNRQGHGDQSLAFGFGYHTEPRMASLMVASPRRNASRLRKARRTAGDSQGIRVESEFMRS